MMLVPADVWTDAASVWPVVIVSRETEGPRLLSNFDPATRSNFVTEHAQPLMQLHLCCARCDNLPSVFCLAPRETTGYVVAIADLLAGILAHMRRSHPDVVAS